LRLCVCFNSATYDGEEPWREVAKALSLVSKAAGLKTIARE